MRGVKASLGKAYRFYIEKKTVTDAQQDGRPMMTRVGGIVTFQRFTLYFYLF